MFENYPLSYHIYIVNQHGQLLHNDITEDTSYELYNLTVCDIYTATVTAHSGEYSSSNVTIQGQYTGGKCQYNIILIFYLFIESGVIIIPAHKALFNKCNNSFDLEFNVTVSYILIFQVINLYCLLCG